jgi:hypothetical protein
MWKAREAIPKDTPKALGLPEGEAALRKWGTARNTLVRKDVDEWCYQNPLNGATSKNKKRIKHRAKRRVKKVEEPQKIKQEAKVSKPKKGYFWCTECAKEYPLKYKSGRLGSHGVRCTSCQYRSTWEKKVIIATQKIKDGDVATKVCSCCGQTRHHSLCWIRGKKVKQAICHLCHRIRHGLEGYAKPFPPDTTWAAEELAAVLAYYELSGEVASTKTSTTENTKAEGQEKTKVTKKKTQDESRWEAVEAALEEVKTELYEVSDHYGLPSGLALKQIILAFAERVKQGDGPSRLSDAVSLFLREGPPPCTIVDVKRNTDAQFTILTVELPYGGRTIYVVKVFRRLVPWHDIGYYHENLTFPEEERTGDMEFFADCEEAREYVEDRYTELCKG